MNILSRKHTVRNSDTGFLRFLVMLPYVSSLFHIIPWLFLVILRNIQTLDEIYTLLTIPRSLGTPSQCQINTINGDVQRNAPASYIAVCNRSKSKKVHHAQYGFQFS